MKEPTKAAKEYLNRNLIVAKAVGVKCGLAVVINRMVLPKKYPKWLYEMLLIEQDKMQSVVNELVKHRDEVNKGKIPKVKGKPHPILPDYLTGRIK